MKAIKVRTKRNRVRAIRRPAAGREARREEVIELVPALLSVKSILVPVDFSDTSKKALHYALRFGEQFGARITLLHVIEPVATPDFAYHPLLLEADKAKQAAKARLEALCSQLGIQARLVERTLTRYGTPFAEICDAARKLKVDLIIITTHGYTGLKHVLLGSTAERVVRHAPCPVLTVREKEHEFV
jgi:nucleotide-binding universal stress UspA family protein